MVTRDSLPAASAAVIRTVYERATANACSSTFTPSHAAPLYRLSQLSPLCRSTVTVSAFPPTADQIAAHVTPIRVPVPLDVPSALHRAADASAIAGGLYAVTLIAALPVAFLPRLSVTVTATGSTPARSSTPTLAGFVVSRLPSTLISYPATVEPYTPAAATLIPAPLMPCSVSPQS